MISHRAFAVAAVFAIGCRGESGDPQAQASAMTSPPAAPATTFTPTPDPTPTDLDPTPSDDIVVTPSGSAVLATTASGRTLTLADVFHADGEWEESRYDIADRSEIQGIAVTLDGCGEDDGAELELRLAHHFTRLTMNVGQANNSRSSENVLAVEIVTNGKQHDTRQIPFDRLQPFSVNVADVNAVKLRFWIDDTSCEYDDGVLAVIEKLTVYG